MSSETLGLVAELNTVKRGLADIDLNFDVVLSAIQKLNDNIEKPE